jgi:hypothetical protein
MGTGAGAEAHHSHRGPNLDPRCSIILLRPRDVQDAREIVCEHGCREVWTDVKSRLGATAGYHPQDIKPGHRIFPLDAKFTGGVGANRAGCPGFERTARSAASCIPSHSRLALDAGAVSGAGFQRWMTAPSKLQVLTRVSSLWK